MRSLRWFADRVARLALAIALAAPVAARAQQQDPPPKIQELMKKSAAGEKLTDAEQQTLIDWYSAQSKAAIKAQMDGMRSKPSARGERPPDSVHVVMPG